MVYEVLRRGHYCLTPILLMSNFHSAGQALQKFLQRLISSLPCSRGHQAFLWACDLPICPVTTCQSLSVSLPINNLERVTFWYINSIWDSPDRSPSSWITGGDSWPGISTDGSFLPGRASCQPLSVKANSRLPLRPDLFYHLLPTSQGGGEFVCASIHHFI